MRSKHAAGEQAGPVALPFGMHRDRPLNEVPGGYLSWLLRTARLSAPLRAALSAELESRGWRVPPAPPPRAVRPCRICGPGPGYLCLWVQDTLGRKRIRAECKSCRRLVDHPPSVPPYSTMADAAASPAPVLDVLIGLEALGVQLRSDGRGVWVDAADRPRVPPDLLAAVRQCSHELAGLLGKGRGRP